MDIMILYWIAIIILLYQTYQEGKKQKYMYITYRTNHCIKCNNYNEVKHKCQLKRHPNNCYDFVRR